MPSFLLCQRGHRFSQSNEVAGFSSTQLDAGLASSLVGSGALDLSGSKVLHVEIAQLEHHGVTGRAPSSYITIPLSAAYGFVESYQVQIPAWKHIKADNLGRLTIRLKDDRGNAFNLADNTYVSMNLLLKAL